LPAVLFTGAPFKVIDAWFAMTSVTQPGWAEAAVLYAGNSSANPAGDYIHGYGPVSGDPYPHNYRVWIPHTC
jgi:hypothetical protein